MPPATPHAPAAPPATGADESSGTAPAPAGPPAADDFWPRVARELADDLAADAVSRERAGKPPSDEVARVREAGLLGVLNPPGAHGRGIGLRRACALVREIAAADGSVGELLARHYALSWSARLLAGPERAAGLEERAADGQWLWAGDVEAPGPGPGLALTPLRGGGHRLDGRRPLATGVPVADRLVLEAVCTATGAPLVVVVDPAAPGVTTGAAHDRFGQRLAGAGDVELRGVLVGADDVLGPGPRDEHSAPASAALAPLLLRLVLTHVGLAVAEGALAEAREAGRSASRERPVPPDGEEYDAAGDRADLLLAYGKLAAALHTATAVVERATEALAGELPAHDSPEGLPADGRAAAPDTEAAVLVATAEAVTGRTAQHVTARVLELADSAGLDRFWRDARALTVRTPTAGRLRAIGDHYLNGFRAPSAATG